jgi:hypothetical protein
MAGVSIVAATGIVQLLDNSWRRSLGQKDAKPLMGFKARKTLLIRCWQVRQRFDAVL